MPLRRSPHRTPTFLGACLANSRKSTGPRTPRGKAHSCLNALKHGRYAKDFRRLVLGRCQADARLYDFVLGQLYVAFEPQTPSDAVGAERMAAQACCWLWVRGRAQGPGTKPECVLESTVSQSTLPSRIGWVATASSGIRLRSPARMRFEINDRASGLMDASEAQAAAPDSATRSSRRTAARWALEKQREGRKRPSPTRWCSAKMAGGP